MTTSQLLPGLWANFDRLLDNLGAELTRPVTAFPAVNVWEDADAYHLEAELPGLTQDEVSIAVTQRNVLTLSGERKSDDGEGRWHRRERGFGRFQRVLRLPAAVDADKVEAKLEGGVLRLTLPKHADAKPRRIAVKAE
ncbi:MAG: Hsp20/alpha crystallin family protein [Gemmataceae bacterium]